MADFTNQLLISSIYHLLNFEKYPSFPVAAREAAVANNFQIVIFSQDYNPVFSVETRHILSIEDMVRKGIEAEKGAYSGLLTAILVWLLGNMTTNGILFVFQNAYPYSNTFDWAIFTNSFVGSTGAGNAIAVIKVLLQSFVLLF